MDWFWSFRSQVCPSGHFTSRHWIGRSYFFNTTFLAAGPLRLIHFSPGFIIQEHFGTQLCYEGASGVCCGLILYNDTVALYILKIIGSLWLLKCSAPAPFIFEGLTLLVSPEWRGGNRRPTEPVLDFKEQLRSVLLVVSPFALHGWIISWEGNSVFLERSGGCP